jgi:hypothetical protein
MGELSDTYDDFPFTEAEVLHSITSMGTKKAAGFDRITADIQGDYFKIIVSFNR